LKHHSTAVIEVTRGDIVESLHCADLALCDGDGNLVAAFGEIDHPVYPRSAIKAFQALPLVESGACDAYGYEDRHLALACSSHNGEAFHVKAARQMLDKAGLEAGDLECGAQAPQFPKAREELYNAQGIAEQIHNNCSGKHAGMLAFARHQGFASSGYVKSTHPVQMEVASVLTDLMGVPHSQCPCGTDGCSIPTYAVPLKNIAAAGAKFCTGVGLANSRAAAASRIISACCDNPEFLAGTGRVCSEIMKVTGIKAFVKVGAEGVYLAMFPHLGLGAALKVGDGGMRAAEALVANLVMSLLVLDDNDRDGLAKIGNPRLMNRNNIDVGEIRLAEETRNQLASITI